MCKQPQNEGNIEKNQHEQRRFYECDVMPNHVGETVKFIFMFRSHETVLDLQTDGWWQMLGLTVPVTRQT
jgi:hypothetical protein